MLAYRRQQINPRQRRLLRLNLIDPALQEIRAVERGKHKAVVTTLAVLAADEMRGTIGRAAIKLIELARHDLMARAAHGMRQRLQPVVFLDRIDQQIKPDALMPVQIAAEAIQSLRIVFERLMRNQPPEPPQAGQQPVVGNAEYDFCKHKPSRPQMLSL